MLGLAHPARLARGCDARELANNASGNGALASVLIDPAPDMFWEPPVLISPHHSNVIYAGAQMVLRSTDRGDHWTEISPDLSTNPPDKILPESEGGVPGGIPWFAISTVSGSDTRRPPTNSTGRSSFSM